MKRFLSVLVLGALSLGMVPISSAEESTPPEALPNLSLSVLRIDEYRIFMKFLSGGTVTTENGKDVAYKISVLNPSGTEMTYKVSTLSAAQLSDGMEMKTFYLPKWEELLNLPALAAGENYTLQVKVDRNDFVKESNEDDNTLSIVLPIDSGASMPDLMASGATVASMDPIARSVTFSYSLSNNSSITIDPTVKGAGNLFLLDDSTIDMKPWSSETDTSYLNAMGASTQTYTIDGTGLSEGMHSFMVCVDANNDPKATIKKGVIAEADEIETTTMTNNCSSSTFMIGADLKASDLRLAKYDGLRLLLNVENGGIFAVHTLSGGAVKVLFQFYDTDGNFIFEKTRELSTDTFAADQTESVGLLLSKFAPLMEAVAAGKTLVAKVSIDPMGDAVEVSKDNNNAELVLTLSADQVPDLYVESITSLGASETLTLFNYVLGNNSKTNVSAKTDGGATTLFVNGVEYNKSIWETSTETPSYLNKKSSSTLEFSVDSSLFGADSAFGTRLETVGVCIDSDAKVAETSESNNCVTYTVAIPE